MSEDSSDISSLSDAPSPDNLLEVQTLVTDLSSAEVTTTDITKHTPGRSGVEANNLKRKRRGTQVKSVRITPVIDGNGDVVATTSDKRRASKRRLSGVHHSTDFQVEAELAEKRVDEANEKVIKGKKASKAESKVDSIEEHGTIGSGEGTHKKVRRKRKTKEEKEAEAMPVAARTVGAKIFVGAHVSSAGGVHNAVTNAVYIGGNAFALFLKSQRKWANPPLQEEHATNFRSNSESHRYDCGRHVVPHGSYLVNLAHTDPTRAAQAYEGFIDDLSRCHSLGISLFNIHPGNFASSTRKEAIEHLARQLNKANVDESSGDVVTLLETMATRGNTIGGTFEDLKEVIELVERKDRVGVCLDTCHVFAAGYDLRSPESFKQTIDDFDRVIGLRYLRALHVNDSKAPLGSNRDLHANIGTGFLGLRAFHNLVNDRRLWGLPFVLETPIEVTNEEGKKVEDKRVWAREIKLLESLVGMDVNSDHFKELENELSAQGEKERLRIQEQVERRMGKAKAKARSAKVNPKKNKNDATDEESDSTLSSSGKEDD